MSNITVTVDDAQVLAMLRRLQANVSDPAPAMRGIGRLLVSRIQRGFRESRDPWGAAWKQLKVARKRNAAGGDRGQPLVDTGRLRNSIASRADASGVIVGTNVVYAAVHQFGGGTIAAHNRLVTGVFGRKLRYPVWATVRAHASGIPARPFMPIRNGRADLPPAWLDAITGALAKHIAKGTA